MKRQNFIYIYLFFYFYTYFVYCVNLKQSDFAFNNNFYNFKDDCILSLGTNIGDTFLKNSQISTFCASGTNYCNSDGSIILLPINASFKNYSLPRSDLNCLPSLNSIIAKNVQLDSNFLYVSGAVNFTELQILNSNILIIDNILTPFSNLIINSLSYNPVKLSYLKNVVKFGSTNLISLDASGDQSTSKLEQIDVILNEVPDFSSSKLGITIFRLNIGPSFDDQTLTSIKNLTSLNQLMIFKTNNDAEIDFPYDIVSLKNLTYLYIDSKLKPVNKLIDLSGNIITSVSLYLGGSNFNYNGGEFPFSLMSKIEMVKFVYNGGNITQLPNLNIFSRVNSLEISNSTLGGTIPKKESNWIFSNFNLQNNKLTGSVDQSWCQTTLILNNNLLGGKLPICIYCYLPDPTISKNFINNNFDNFNTSSTCSYDDDIFISKVSGSNTVLTLVGKNIGYNGLNIKTTPESYQLSPIGTGFSGYYKTPIDLTIVKFIEIRLMVPGINFTVATKPYNPDIRNVNQMNTTIQINGEFFSYDKSSIIATIGSKNCMVLKSMFYNIQCDLGYPVTMNGDFTLQINSSGLLGTFPINIKKTIFPCSPIDCNNKGICDGGTGKCNCDSKYTTIDSNNMCSIPNHYISSSTQVPSSIGGTIELNGWFGDIYSFNQLIINDKIISQVININSTTLTVKIDSGIVGPVKVNYTQNGLIWTGLIYPYYNTIKSCPSNCYAELNQGKCNTVTGNCECNSNFTGFDCKLQINKDDPSSETNVINNGSTIITNQDIQFLISIDNIQEIDFNNNMVDLFNLTNNWILNNKSDSITTFKQILMNNITQLSLTIEEVNKSDKTFNFANNIFTISKGGFKISISITDWVFKSNLNTLQIQISTDLTTEIINNNNNNCNQDIQIESLSSNDDDYNKILNGINYLKVSKNGKTLYGRFQDKMLSDGRENIVITKISSQDDKSVKVILNLPHCTQCLIDPDFSLLVNPNFQSSCKDGDNDNSRKWVIPVAVVISVVGAATLIIVGFIIYKRSTILKVQVHKLKRFNNKNKD
ncbi:hypothetical protein ACTA71_008927 [Dictyostelium dimigraforme]